MKTATRTGLTPDVVDFLVATATRAPSVHNTQPWLFRFVDGAMELRADPSRGLRISDPGARELMISCGAALYTLELAIRRLGLEPRTQLLPDAEEPQLLARVRGLPGGRPTREELRLLQAITRRHSHRSAFTGRRPGSQLLDDLRLVARLEGAYLTIVPDGPTAQRVVELAWAADTEQRTDLAWRAEMNKWANKPGTAPRDGVPPEVYAEQAVDYDGRQLPARDFSLRRRWGRGDKAGVGASVLALLTTDGDGPRAWLQAGMALQHVLLQAAGQWVFANFATQALELPDIRAALRDATHTSAHPQMLFQLGHAHTAQLTARRPVRDVLDRPDEIRVD
jgi:nitroreductase